MGVEQSKNTFKKNMDSNANPSLSSARVFGERAGVGTSGKVVEGLS